MAEISETGVELMFDHPYEQELLKDPLIKELVMHIDTKEETIWRETHPDGEREEDNIFVHDEGMMTRLPVLMKWVVDYLKETGRLS